MKKKFAIIVVSLLACACMIFAVQTLQKEFVNEAVNGGNKTTTQVSTESNKAKNSDNIAKGESDTSSSKNSDSQVKPQQNSNSAVSQSPAKNTTSTAEQQKPQAAAKPSMQAPQQPVNFEIIDTVHNKVILSCHVDYPDGTVEKITSSLLKNKMIPFRAINSISGSYFSMIANLKERDSGPYSGWCYYINNKKSSVGASGYTPEKDDVIMWKYLADGVSN